MAGQYSYCHNHILDGIHIALHVTAYMGFSGSVQGTLIHPRSRLLLCIGVRGQNRELGKTVMYLKVTIFLGY